MKTTKSLSLIAALALVLPAGAFAQAGSTGSSTPSRTSQLDPLPGASRPDGSTTSSQMSSSHAQQIKLIPPATLKDKKLTAENLLGKKIVDRDGQEIGTVKDIGFGSAMQESRRPSFQTYSTTGSANGGTGSDSRRNVDPNSSSGSASTRTDSMSERHAYSSDQPILYVKLDGKVDIKGNDLAAIPVSHVRFDHDKEQFMLQVARSELTSQLKQNGSAYNR